MEISGVIPANIMPFTERGTIDEDEYARHLGDLIGTPGVTGITCNGHAAEVASLSRDERRRAVSIAHEVVDGKGLLVAGIYAEDQGQAVEYAKDAVAEGADALLVFPMNGLRYGLHSSAPIEYFQAIAEHIGHPMVVFIYPEWTGAQYSTSVLGRILQIPQVAAVKEWSLDIAKYETHLKLIRGCDHHVSLMSSFSTNLLPSLLLGADGIISGHGSVIADLQVQLFAAVSDKNIDEARRVYQRIQILTPYVYSAPMGEMYSRMKTQLVQLGRLKNSYSRPPFAPVGDDEAEVLRSSLCRAGLLRAADH